jgi:hypothetical protein
MQALEVSVNGRQICVAGTTPNKVLSTALSWTARNPTWKFHVGGIVGGDSREHFAWDVPELQVGDVVSFRVIETESCDTPARIYDPAKES